MAPPAGFPAGLPVDPPPLRGRVIFEHDWRDLAFLHWSLPPEVVAPLLPGTRPDTFDGDTFVALVPFELRGAKVFGSPAFPYIGDFLETNLRLYSEDDYGRQGVVFASLETSRLAVALAARTAVGLPYTWSRQTSSVPGSRRTWTTRRRWPDPFLRRCAYRVRRTRAAVGAGAVAGGGLRAQPGSEGAAGVSGVAVGDSRHPRFSHDLLDRPSLCAAVVTAADHGRILAIATCTNSWSGAARLRLTITSPLRSAPRGIFTGPDEDSGEPWWSGITASGYGVALLQALADRFLWRLQAYDDNGNCRPRDPLWTPHRLRRGTGAAMEARWPNHRALRAGRTYRHLGVAGRDHVLVHSDDIVLPAHVFSPGQPRASPELKVHACVMQGARGHPNLGPECDKAVHLRAPASHLTHLHPPLPARRRAEATVEGRLTPVSIRTTLAP